MHVLSSLFHLHPTKLLLQPAKFVTVLNTFVVNYQLHHRFSAYFYTYGCLIVLQVQS